VAGRTPGKRASRRATTAVQVRTYSRLHRHLRHPAAAFRAPAAGVGATLHKVRRVAARHPLAFGRAGFAKRGANAARLRVI
ncbi:hypothetical protein, partial [Escherichia coli]|uniref:hypothetical protein n=1 Tax=Escherichia coli TaxID=562 RepID=UPI001436BD23